MPITYSHIIFAEKGKLREAGFYFKMGLGNPIPIPDEKPFFLSTYYGPYPTFKEAQKAKEELLYDAEKLDKMGPGLPPEWDVIREFWDK